MEPCTWINKSGIPTLQDIVSIFQALPQAVQSITCGRKVALSAASIFPVKMKKHIRNFIRDELVCKIFRKKKIGRLGKNNVIEISKTGKVRNHVSQEVPKHRD
jgi:hypothetical protein